MSYYSNSTRLRPIRRQLRQNATRAEKIFWQEVRYRQFRYKFRRQYDIAGIIVDFYCHELRLVVEIDGSIHGEEKIMQRDEQKNKKLENLGYLVLRYTNDAVLNNMDDVKRDLENQITEREKHISTKVYERTYNGQTVSTR